jgi:hypothetical protein
MKNKAKSLGDHEIRTCLRDWLRRGRHGKAPTIVDELVLDDGANRCDVTIAAKGLHGFEIKSDRDRLTRLASQAACYGRFFRTMTLVTTERHFNKAAQLVPTCWGLVIAKISNGKIVLRRRRAAKVNPNTSSKAMASLLWKREAADILRRRGYTRDLRELNRDRLCELVAQVVLSSSLAEVVSMAIQRRGDWRGPRRPARDDGWSRSSATSVRRLHSLAKLIEP